MDQESGRKSASAFCLQAIVNLSKPSNMLESRYAQEYVTISGSYAQELSRTLEDFL